VAATLGLAGASEVWGGDGPRDRPAWYLWLAGTGGAWQVELEESQRLDGAGPAAFAGRFTIRHYPSSIEPCFASFSPDEQAVASGWLDATGTPRIELASRIPRSFFTVGSIDWGVDLESEATVLVFGSLDRLRVRDRGRLVREVPGWRLGFPVFSLLAGLHAQLERRAASRLVLARRHGFEISIDGGEELLERESDTVQGELSLAFPPPGARAHLADTLLQELRDPGATLVMEEALSPACQHLHSSGFEARLPVTVSSTWFGGEPPVEDRVACAC
jgi:hypothetical protein